MEEEEVVVWKEKIWSSQQVEKESYYTSKV